MTCDLNKAQPIILDETMQNDERIEMIMASASIPFAFQPREVEDMFLIDGGAFSNVAIGDPIERCREEGYDDEDIIVDILLCYEKPLLMEAWDVEAMMWETAWNFYDRRKKIRNYHFHTEEVQRLYRGYHKVNFRLVIQPSKSLTSTGAVPINAGHKELNNERAQGYSDGTAAVYKLLQSEDATNVDDAIRE